MKDSEIFNKFIDADQLNGWGELYFDLTSALVTRYSCKDILEIGVAFGAHAEKFIVKDAVSSYTGIDPYLCAYDSDDPFSADIMGLTNIFDQRSFDMLHAYTSFKLSKYEAIRLYRSSISECYHKLKKYDFIFIDGNHSYDAVLEDLHFSKNFINKGGIIVGDDVTWTGVDKAWRGFSSLYNYQIKKIENGNYCLYYIEF